MRRFRILFCLLVPVSVLSQNSHGAAPLQPWKCGMVDESSLYTPDAKRFPPGQRQEPLGCSAKPMFRGTLDWISQSTYGLNLPIPYNQLFHSACIRHDLCYRHGNATYGYLQTHCDNELEKNLEQICKTDVSDPEQKKSCLNLPKYFAGAVKMFGSKYFRSSNNDLKGLYCEYRTSKMPKPLWPHFGEVVKFELSPFWLFVRDHSSSVTPLGKTQLQLLDFESLRQVLLKYFAEQATSTEVVVAVKMWTSKDPANLREAHEALGQWARSSKKLLKKNRLIL